MDLLRCSEDVALYFAKQDAQLALQKSAFDAQIAQDNSQLNTCKEILEDVTSGVRSMASQLQDFESRMEDLASDLNDLNLKANVLSYRQTNIQETIKSLTSYHECFIVADGLAKTLENEIRIDDDIHKFATLLDQLLHVELYLKEFESFPAARALIRRFSDIIALNLSSIQNYTQSLLRHELFNPPSTPHCQSQPPASPRGSKKGGKRPFLAPLPVHQSEDNWSTLQKLCHFLESKSCVQFLTEALKSLRQSTIKSTIDNLNLSQSNIVLPPPPTGFYSTKSHPLCTLLPQFVTALRSEISLVLGLISRGSAAKYSEELIRPFIILLLDYAKSFEKAIKSENLKNSGWTVTNRLYLVLDLFQLIREISPELQAINVDTAQILNQNISDFEQIFTKIAKHYLELYPDHIFSERFLPTKPQWVAHSLPGFVFPEDGSVHWVVLQISGAIQYLVEFKTKYLTELFRGSANNLHKYLDLILNQTLSFINNKFHDVADRNQLLYKTFQTNNVGFLKSRIDNNSQLQQILPSTLVSNIASKFSILSGELVSLFLNHWSIANSFDHITDTISPSETLNKNERRAIKETLKAFNDALEARCEGTKPIIIDGNLRTKIVNTIIPCITDKYVEFSARFESTNFSTHKSNYFKYRPEVIAEKIGQYFCL
ncbi:hypothetical protein RCL1_001488 [Eukaryota sp. TZLM3-RCL]